MIRDKIETTFELQLAVWKYQIAEIAQAHDIQLHHLMIRIRREEIGSPPPEYWEKIASGLPRAQALREIGWTPPMIRKISEILKYAREQTKKIKRKVHR